MGPLVTVNSATLVNKGLEVIEAHLLFGFGLDRIDVVVHPQSIVHSMVEFADGATVIMASPPDMRLPISLGLAWPDRVPEAAPGLDWSDRGGLDLRAAGRRGVPRGRAGPRGGRGRAAPRRPSTTPPTRPAWRQFLAGRIGFTRIVDTVARILSEHDAARAAVTTVADVLAVDDWARRRAREINAAELHDASERGRPDGPDRLGHLHRRPALLRHAARDRSLRAGQEVRHEGHPLLRRLRADDLVHLARRDRIRDQGAAARRLRQDRRHALAGRSRGPRRRGPVVPQQARLAADRGAVRRARPCTSCWPSC